MPSGPKYCLRICACRPADTLAKASAAASVKAPPKPSSTCSPCALPLSTTSSSAPPPSARSKATTERCRKLAELSLWRTELKTTALLGSSLSVGGRRSQACDVHLTNRSAIRPSLEGVPLLHAELGAAPIKFSMCMCHTSPATAVVVVTTAAATRHLLRGGGCGRARLLCCGDASSGSLSAIPGMLLLLRRRRRRRWRRRLGVNGRDARGGSKSREGMSGHFCPCFFSSVCAISGSAIYIYTFLRARECRSRRK